MRASNDAFSAPLQQLMDEHVSLRADMDHFYEITEDIEFETGPAVVEMFAKLFERVSSFNDKLKTHSKRGLFPLMTRHLGENDRSIEVMEFEHEKAEQHLLAFLTEADKKGPSIDENDVQWITVYAVQAHATLTQHFAKDEKVLFPLAEKILSVEEMEELGRLFQAIG